MTEKEKVEAEQNIELAGELALAWCRKQTKEVAAIWPQTAQDDYFRIGWTAACEELGERLETMRFSAILETTTDAMGYPKE